jgi:uncharacterized membrane protein YfcA
MRCSLSLDVIWILVLVVFLAAVIRGYAGFGFTAIAVVGLNLFLLPQQSIPVVLGLDLLCSAPLMRQAARQAEMPTFKLLTLGSFVGIPFGLALLLFVPSEYLKLIICTAILIFSALLIMNVRFRHTDKALSKLIFGMLAGIGTSGASVGGPVVVFYMLSSSLNVLTQRATLIMFFIVSELIAIAALFSGGLIDLEIVKLVFILLIPTLIAVRCGQYLFNRYPPKSLKHFALPVMVMVSLLGISAVIRGYM